MSSLQAGTVDSPYVFGEELLSVCSTALVQTVGGVIERAFTANDVPSVDCEMLAVVMGGITRQPVGGQTPLGGAQAHKLGWMNLVLFKILVARDCQPVGSDNGDAPTPAELAQAQREAAQDAWVIWHAIPSAMAAGGLFGGRCAELMMDNAVPLPVSGGVAGWVVTLRTNVPGFVYEPSS